MSYTDKQLGYEADMRGAIQTGGTRNAEEENILPARVRGRGQGLWRGRDATWWALSPRQNMTECWGVEGSRP